MYIDALGAVLEPDIEIALWAVTERRARCDGRGSVRARKGRTIPPIRRFHLLTLRGVENAAIKLAFGVHTTPLAFVSGASFAAALPEGFFQPCYRLRSRRPFDGLVYALQADGGRPAGEQFVGHVARPEARVRLDLDRGRTPAPFGERSQKRAAAIELADRLLDGVDAAAGLGRDEGRPEGIAIGQVLLASVTPCPARDTQTDISLDARQVGMKEGVVDELGNRGRSARPSLTGGHRRVWRLGDAGFLAWRRASDSVALLTCELLGATRMCETLLTT